MKYLIAALIGYWIGNFNLAHLMAKKRGFDIRTRGTHNPGASNAFVTMGRTAGVMVGACDIAKAAIAGIISGILFPGVPNIKLIAGAACVMGHMFPAVLKFRGGKGFASFLGMILAVNWKFFIAIGIAVIIVTLVTDYIVLGTMTTVISFPIFMFFVNAGLVAVTVISMVSAIIIFKHRGNLKRIARGEEMGFRKANKNAEP